ncbi:hypothetical protein IFM89_020477, partial [Coptis chinensis]
DDESVSTSSPDNSVHGLPAFSVQEHNLEFSQPITDEERSEAKVTVLLLYSVIGARKDVKNLSCDSSEGEVLQWSNLKRFSYNQLENATKNFHPKLLLGNGNGPVFKGWINEHTLDATEPEAGIAIVVIRLLQEGYLDDKAWLEKVNYLGQLRHPNLARLVGYCLEDPHRLLVYEFTSQGILQDQLNLLHNAEKPLSWSLRMKIALGAAKGLAFLHCAKTNVIHGNFKTCNILLDKNYNAKISFALVEDDGPIRPKIDSSIGLMESVHGVFDVVSGVTAFQSCPKALLTAQSDVHSFGVALLQLLSGELSGNQWSLKEWANLNLKDEVQSSSVLDRRLKGQYPQIKAIKAAKLALQCVSKKEKLPPDMNKVVIALEKLI